MMKSTINKFTPISFCSFIKERNRFREYFFNIAHHMLIFLFVCLLQVNSNREQLYFMFFFFFLNNFLSKGWGPITDKIRFYTVISKGSKFSKKKKMDLLRTFFFFLLEFTLLRPKFSCFYQILAFFYQIDVNTCNFRNHFYFFSGDRDMTPNKNVFVMFVTFSFLFI